MEIRIQDISKHFAGFRALNGVDLDIADGELIAVGITSLEDCEAFTWSLG